MYICTQHSSIIIIIYILDTVHGKYTQCRGMQEAYLYVSIGQYRGIYTVRGLYTEWGHTHVHEGQHE